MKSGIECDLGHREQDFDRTVDELGHGGLETHKEPEQDSRQTAEQQALQYAAERGAGIHDQDAVAEPGDGLCVDRRRSAPQEIVEHPGRGVLPSQQQHRDDDELRSVNRKPAAPACRFVTPHQIIPVLCDCSARWFQTCANSVSSRASRTVSRRSACDTSRISTILAGLAVRSTIRSASAIASPMS